MEQYFNKDGKHYFTEEEKEALKALIEHLSKSYKEFWEEREKERETRNELVLE